MGKPLHYKDVSTLYLKCIARKIVLEISISTGDFLLGW